MWFNQLFVVVASGLFGWFLKKEMVPTIYIYIRNIMKRRIYCRMANGTSLTVIYGGRRMLCVLYKRAENKCLVQTVLRVTSKHSE